MISRTVEYALRAVVWLATRPQSPHTTRAIAEVMQVPPPYLSKVLQTLAEAGVVTSQRGLGGGFELARRSDQISVLDVVNAVDPFQRIRACPLHLAAHETRLCALHQRLDDAMATVEAAFAGTTIAELADSGDFSDEACPRRAATGGAASRPQPIRVMGRPVAPPGNREGQPPRQPQTAAPRAAGGGRRRKRSR